MTNTLTKETVTTPATTIAETRGEIIMLNNYADVKARFENVSLRKLATADDSLSYPMLLKASKKPIEGVPYDPTAINYDAVDEYLNKKDFDWKNTNWEALNSEPVRKAATLSKDINDFNVGELVYLRISETPFEIIYKTETHIVLLELGTTEPRCLNHSTFFFKGPSKQPRQPKEATE